MARIEISGVGIEYELLGPEDAHCVSITPGGRMSMQAGGVRELGEALAALGKRVLLWDRPNCGLSDFHFEGENESAMQARMLTQLIRALGLGPTALAGGSAGSRCTLLAAVQDPEAVSHLVQWWISGGTVSLMMLGASYDCEPAIAASMGGMEAVTKLTAFAEPLQRRPEARAELLAQDPAQFIATMERWAEAFVPQKDSPVPGVSPADWANLKMPVLIFRGSENDMYHNRRITDWAHRLIPHSEYVDSPWDDNAFARRMTEAAQGGGSPLVDWPMLAPAIAEFTSR
ncbi:MAG: alpha/beta fold hydrolase [Novosphingobium sp.]